MNGLVLKPVAALIVFPWHGSQDQITFNPSFCKSVYNFGSVEKAAKAKLLSNFLSLLTTTTVIEFFRSANTLLVEEKHLSQKFG